MVALHNTPQHSGENDYMEFWGKKKKIIIIKAKHSNGCALHYVTQTLFWLIK